MAADHIFSETLPVMNRRARRTSTGARTPPRLASYSAVGRFQVRIDRALCAYGRTEITLRDTGGQKAKRTRNGPTLARAESLLLRLQSAFDRYPNALVRAAQYILENPEKVIHQSLAELSTYSETGQASIVRLCQELGYDGYTQFKIALSADLALRGATPTPEGPANPLRSDVAPPLRFHHADTRVDRRDRAAPCCDRPFEGHADRPFRLWCVRDDRRSDCLPATSARLPCELDSRRDLGPRNFERPRPGFGSGRGFAVRGDSRYREVPEDSLAMLEPSPWRSPATRRARSPRSRTRR